MTINGESHVYGIVGYPVKHSLSPIFQNSAFEFFNLNAVYVPFEVKPEDFETALKGFKVIGVRGLNITLPHKERALELSDFPDEHAKAIGSANTLKFTEEGVYAYNTDWIGFLKALSQLMPEIRSREVLLLGAGGSARAVAYALKKEGARVYVWNRTLERAERLAEEFGFQVVQKPEEVLDRVQLIVNSTSSGLKEDDPPLFNYELLNERHSVFDLIYKDTPLLRSARRKGCAYKDGLDMLLYQGMESFRIWTGLEVPYEVVKCAVVRYIHGHIRS